MEDWKARDQNVRRLGGWEAKTSHLLYSQPFLNMKLKSWEA
jgi:hypothetical protein